MLRCCYDEVHTSSSTCTRNGVLLLRTLHASEIAAYRADPDGAATLAAIGEHPRRDGLDARAAS